MQVKKKPQRLCLLRERKKHKQKTSASQRPPREKKTQTKNLCASAPSARGKKHKQKTSAPQRPPREEKNKNKKPQRLSALRERTSTNLITK